ncbi:MAG: DUF1801 domain-containing protein [Flavobacteriales bacterium]|nr:DUF1801 domain-containing protein [Flavobacteriales bacterium]
MAGTERKRVAKRTTKPPVRLLSGGNPQIAKGYGNEPVRAYLDAIPDWKRAVAERLDALIERTVPQVTKAVKWNTPLYGLEGNGWFMGYHMITKYVKVSFFNGAALKPMPPVESKQPKVRYLHIHEHDVIDEKQLAQWIAQAAAMPGERM